VTILVPVIPGVPTFDTCVVIPTHPARGAANDPTSLLGRAVASVMAQTIHPERVAIAMDVGRMGAAKTRQDALDEALTQGTEFVSFLDSDDTWYPHHLATHRRLLCGESGTEDLGDVAYSWFDGNQGLLQMWEKTHRGKVFDPESPHHTTMTLTMRSSFARQIKMANHPDANPEWTGEDWFTILQLRDLGARFVGTGEVTWTYQVDHGGNTSGSPLRGDAATPA